MKKQKTQNQPISGIAKETLDKLNAEVKRIESEKKAKFEIDEPVRFRAGKFVMPAFVRRIIPASESKHNRIYYDLICMKPMEPGSAILHNVVGIAETQVFK